MIVVSVIPNTVEISAIQKNAIANESMKCLTRSAISYGWRSDGKKICTNRFSEEQ